MKKTYESPMAEKLEFDYTQVVATSAGGSQNSLGTVQEQWCHGPVASQDNASRC